MNKFISTFFGLIVLGVAFALGRGCSCVSRARPTPVRKAECFQELHNDMKEGFDRLERRVERLEDVILQHGGERGPVVLPPSCPSGLEQRLQELRRLDSETKEAWRAAEETSKQLETRKSRARVLQREAEAVRSRLRTELGLDPDP